ncbi:hypothetical protein GCM10029976_037380 [Kribbella albertanoniae]
MGSPPSCGYNTHNLMGEPTKSRASQAVGAGDLWCEVSGHNNLSPATTDGRGAVIADTGWAEGSVSFRSVVRVLRLGSAACSCSRMLLWWI